MVLPFKKTTGATTDNVKDYDFKDHYTAINRNMDWGDISPQIRHSIEKYILPFIGETIYDDIVTKIQAGTSLTGNQPKFAELLKDAAAYYSAMSIMVERKTMLTSMGPIEPHATENTTGSSLWGFKTTLWAISQKADELMDKLLSKMEDFVEAADSYFVTNWADTDAYDAVSTSFFRYAKDFQPYHNIYRSFRNFKRLVPIIDECAERYIKPILCTAQYDALLAAIKANTETADQLTLIVKVRRSLAKWVVYEACMQIPFLPDQEGFRIISNADSVDQRSYPQQSFQQAIQGIRESCERSAKTFTADLVEFLYDNKDDYPLWEASTCNKLNNTDPDTSIYDNGPGGVFI